MPVPSMIPFHVLLMIYDVSAVAVKIYLSGYKNRLRPTIDADPPA